MAGDLVLMATTFHTSTCAILIYSGGYNDCRTLHEVAAENGGFSGACCKK